MAYTCTDYRGEMILLGLRRRLFDEHLNAVERETLEAQIREIEKMLGLEEP